VTDLAPLVGFNASQANAVNSAGVVVGYSETPAGVTEATMWANGQVIDLGAGIATAVNDSNQVVGYSVEDTGLIVTAHLWFNGAISDLGSWLPQRINNLGLIVGSPVDFGPALQWSTTTGLTEIAGCPYALAVNDSATIAGIDYQSNATVCGQPSYGQQGAVTAINASGQVVGYASPDSATSNAILWPSTVLAQQGLATSINELGWVVGETFTTGGTNGRARAQADRDWAGNWGNTWLHSRICSGGLSRDAIAALVGQSHPFIWSQASGLVALPDPLITAEGINGSRVVGAGLATDGTIHGFLLEGR